MKTILFVALISVSAMFAQSSQTDPGARTIREEGKHNQATQDTTADQAPNTPPPANAPGQKSKARPRQAKSKAAAPANKAGSKEAK